MGSHPAPRIHPPPPTMTGLLLLALCSSAVAFTARDLPMPEEDGELWVLLVAGSNGWFNYRHQADVCHAYQIVHAHGVPDDHIIVMMYDDIAYNKENPTPGKIINQPNGSDVYHGLPKDYVCGSVRPDIFLQVLQGEKVDGVFGTGKTLASGPRDNVFVYFADHGAKGLVAFGQETLKATALNKAIKDMYAAKKYNKMVFYVEACESGTMFKGLLDANMNVFATTASNATTAEEAKEAREKLDQLMRNRKFMESTVHTLVTEVTQDSQLTGSMFSDNVELTDFDCYYAAVDEFHARCFNVGQNDYALRMLNPLVNLCQKGFTESTIISAIKAICTHPPMVGIH